MVENCFNKLRTLLFFGDEVSKIVKRDFEEYVIDIAEHVSVGLGDTLDAVTIRPIAKLGGVTVIDTSLPFYIDGKSQRDDVVLLLSSKHFPLVVNEDVDKAQAISRLLHASTSQNISRPLLTDSYGEQSYAVFERLQPMAENRAVRYLQKRYFFPKVASWLSELAMQTRRHYHDEIEIQNLFIEPLQSISTSSDMPTNIREFSEHCISKALDCSSTLFTVAEHGDFWSGNVLFRRTLPRNLSPFLGDFVVIDWRGSNIRGYPCSDLVRYCLSCYRPKSIHVGNALRNYNASLEIENFQVGIYLLASVGRLGLNLDQMPRDLYLVLCERIFSLMGAHGFTSKL